jgi:hypothetical protein
MVSNTNVHRNIINTPFHFKIISSMLICNLNANTSELHFLVQVLYYTTYTAKMFWLALLGYISSTQNNRKVVYYLTGQQ